LPIYRQSEKQSPLTIPAPTHPTSRQIVSAAFSPLLYLSASVSLRLLPHLINSDTKEGYNQAAFEPNQ